MTCGQHTTFVRIPIIVGRKIIFAHRFWPVKLRRDHLIARLASFNFGKNLL